MSILQQLESSILSPSKLQDDGVPSASLALLDNGELTTHVITNGPENPETIYQCGSISKAITALGIARLVDQGLISYDSKIVDLIPSDLPGKFLEPETVHLLDLVTPYDPGHPSGVERPTTEQSIRGDPKTSTTRMRFASFSGSQLLYCSGAFTLLQITMERICKKKFPELMQELVMRPLGMTRSFYGELSKNEPNYAGPHLTGHQATPTGVHRFTELAAVGLWSTPADLLKTVLATQQSLYTDKGFLSQATAQEILINGAVTFRSGAARHRCGLGWYSTSTVFAHRGANPGYHSYVFGFFDEADPSMHRSGFAVMTNSQMGLETIRPLVSAVLYLKGWPRQKLMPSSLGVDDYVPYAAPKSTKIDDRWRKWLGEWEGGWSLIEHDGHPTLTFGESGHIQLLLAAAPIAHESEEPFLVANGLSEIAIRLTHEGRDPVIELLQLQKTILRRM